VESLLNGSEVLPEELEDTSIFATLRYLVSLECHVYAFAVAANVLLSFFPFLVLILTVAQGVFHWHAAANAIYVGVKDYLPDDPGLVDFVVTNLRASVESPGRGQQLLSVFMLLFSSNGIFVPLEVALNRLWGLPVDRSYLRNQILSLGLTFGCGLLVLGAALLTSRNVVAVRGLMGASMLPERATLIALRLSAVPLSIVAFILVYWVLPNGTVPFRRAVFSAFVAGLSLECAKHAYLFAWPHLGFRHAYGPFFISVTVLIWGYVSALIVLAGGGLGARGTKRTRGPGQSSSPSTNH
jgi:membrane protein